MEIGELQVFNTMDSSIVELENHSHGMTIVRVDSLIIKEIISEEDNY